MTQNFIHDFIDEDIAQVEAARDAKWEVMRRDWA